MTKFLDVQGPWLRAGLPDLQNPIRAAKNMWRRPSRVELSKGRVRGRRQDPEEAWLAFFPDKEPRFVRAGSGLLLRFLALADSTDDQVLDYARRWGPLDIDGQQMDKVLEMRFGMLASYFKDGRPGRSKARTLCHSERVEGWRSLAREGQALLAIAARLHAGKVGELEDWRHVILDAYPSHPGYEKWVATLWGFLSKKNLRANYSEFSGAIGRWLSWGEVRFSFWWDEGGNRPKMSIGSRTLFGHLALELALRVSKHDGFTFCSACGKPYAPDRLQSGRLHFCKTCGRPAALRLAQERRRAKVAALKAQKKRPRRPRRRPER